MEILESDQNPIWVPDRGTLVLRGPFTFAYDARLYILTSTPEPF